METEQAMFQWDNATAGIMKGMINRIPIYLADLDPVFWEMPFPVPLSAPFVAQIEPFSHPMGLRQAISLIKDVEAGSQPEDYQKLNLNNWYPRIGPGKVKHTVSKLRMDQYEDWFSRFRPACPES